MGTIPSSRQSIFLAGLTFAVFLIFGYVSDLLQMRHPNWTVTDDLIMAGAAAALVFRYERERSRFLSEKLRVIRDMNSFVRNELQILYTCLETQDKSRVSTIERSVERIDWALRELLPGGQPLATIPVEKTESSSAENRQRSA